MLLRIVKNGGEMNSNMNMKNTYEKLEEMGSSLYSGRKPSKIVSCNSVESGFCQCLLDTAEIYHLWEHEQNLHPAAV